MVAAIVLQGGLAAIYGCQGRPWTVNAILGVLGAMLLLQAGTPMERA